MNYMKCYYNIMERAKNRGKLEGYFEKHHINPDFMFKHRKRKGPIGHLEGDPDSPSNVVCLTPREHFVAHLLLAKGLQGKRYWASAASALIFFTDKVITKHIRQKNFVPTSRLYEMARNMGIKGISNNRRNKIPVKDKMTGIIIGSIDRNHPKILSGEWVHHMIGRKWTDKERLMRPSGIGIKNNNYRIMTEEHKQRLFKLVPYSVDRGYVHKGRFEILMKEEFQQEFKKVSYQWINNNFSSFASFIDEYNNLHQDKVIYITHGKSNRKQL